jgi:hypothetical protein
MLSAGRSVNTVTLSVLFVSVSGEEESKSG